MAKLIKQKDGGTLNFLKTEGKEGEPPKYITAPDAMDEELRKQVEAEEVGGEGDRMCM